MIKFCIAILLAIFFTNCKKEYTCTCTWQGTQVSKSVGKMTKKDAQKECERQQNEGSWAVSPVICESK